MTPRLSSALLRTGITLAYAEAGDPTARAVVLLPGPTDSWRSYEPMLGYMPSSIRTIAVSQRGHGDSDKPPSGYAVNDFAADVPPLLDALGVQRAVLAGHSGSCLVARRVALDHPERVAGLVLEASPSTLHSHAGLKAFVASVVADLRDPVELSVARSVITDTSSERVAPELIDVFARELTKVPSHVWKEMFAGLLAYDDLEEIHRITAPTLLLWGDADGIVDREMQVTLIEHIPDTEFVVYNGVGHTPRWESPSRFADDVASYVERCSVP